MRCPYCGIDDDKVVDSRSTDDGTAIRRRRLCNGCGRRYTTYERVEGEEQIRVLKSDGCTENFDRRKLLAGLHRACEKRPVATEDLEAVVNRCYQSFLADGLREVPSKRIGEAIMDELRTIDQVAYVRFASVYRQFKHVDDFMSELRKVIASEPE